jgi:hypothetical protein
MNTFKVVIFTANNENTRSVILVKPTTKLQEVVDHFCRKTRIFSQDFEVIYTCSKTSFYVSATDTFKNMNLLQEDGILVLLPKRRQSYW